MTINYTTLPFGLRRPRIMGKEPQYGLWDKTGDWATSGMAYHNIYWNFGEYLNDWSSGELSDELMQDLLDNPQDWGFCDYCSEGPRGDQDGFIRLKDWSDPDAHINFDPDNANECDLANPPKPRKDFVISENQMDLWWPFYHLTGPTGLAEKDYIDLEKQVSSFGNPDNIYPFQSRMWWYFEPQHERDNNSDSITYKFDRDRFLEDTKKYMAKANKLDPSANQMAIINRFSKYDSVLNIAKKEMITPALGKITPVFNYKIVKNPDKTAQCIMPNCQSKIMVGEFWENTCKNPLMRQ